MTVKELIEKLDQCPHAATVILDHGLIQVVCGYTVVDEINDEDN